jgi:hypothetical protein
VHYKERPWFLPGPIYFCEFNEEGNVLFLSPPLLLITALGDFFILDTSFLYFFESSLRRNPFIGSANRGQLRKALLQLHLKKQLLPAVIA